MFFNASIEKEITYPIIRDIVTVQLLEKFTLNQRIIIDSNIQFGYTAIKGYLISIASCIFA